MLANLHPAPLPTGVAEVAEQGKASPKDSLADWAGAARSSVKSLRALLTVFDPAVLCELLVGMESHAASIASKLPARSIIVQASGPHVANRIGEVH